MDRENEQPKPVDLDSDAEVLESFTCLIKSYSTNIYADGANHVIEHVPGIRRLISIWGTVNGSTYYVSLRFVDNGPLRKPLVSKGSLYGFFLMEDYAEIISLLESSKNRTVHFSRTRSRGEERRTLSLGRNSAP